MKFTDYIEQAKTTAIYPKKQAKDYLILGLISELGEVAGVLKKYIRDKFSYEELEQKLVKELGDCYWYIGMLCVDVFKVEDEEDINDLLDTYSHLTYYDVNDGLITLSKCFRLTSQLHYVTNQKHLYLTEYSLLSTLCSYLNSFSDLSSNLNITYVLEQNLLKLQGRKNNNTLTGDGDNR